MIRWIVESSLKFRVLVIFLAAALIATGIMTLPDAKVDVLPEFGPPTVEIQAEALGLSAAEVEQLITVPMEQLLLNGVAWLDEIESESLPGLSRIVLTFDKGTDPLRARQVVQERLTMARDLPRVSKPPIMIQPLSATSRVMMIRLDSDDVSPIEMSVLARWTIRPRLMGVPGVANVSIWGQRERQLQVQVDPELLVARGVSMDQVIETTGNALWVSPLSFLEASTPGSGGFIDTPNQRLGIQHLLPITTAEELAKVPIEGCSGGMPSITRHVDAVCPTPPDPRPLTRLGDVATVVEDHQPLIGDAVSTDGQGLLLVIEKFPETNALEVTKGVEDALDAMSPGLEGIEIDTTVYRPAGFIETAIDNLAAALLVALILVVVLFSAFFFDWRSALISAVAIPLSLVGAALVLYFRDATFNAMILAGFVVALGIIIDDAIVDVDNIKRRLQQRQLEGRNTSVVTTIVDASMEVRGPIIFATMIILLAATPIYYLAYSWGMTGAFFQPVAISYALALLASMLIALIVTPTLAVLLLSRGPLNRRDSPIMSVIQRGYDRTLSRLAQRPTRAYGTLMVVALLGLGTLPFLDHSASMVPSFQERDLLIHWEGPPGTSHPEMVRITEQVSRELESIPGVRNVGAHVGRAVTSDQIVNINSGELWVSLTDNADYDRTVANVRNVIDGYPGLDHQVLTYLEETAGDAGRVISPEVVVRVYGQDTDVLLETANLVQQNLSQVDGVANAQVELQTIEPQVEIETDLARAEAYGLKPGDIRRAAAAMISGIEVGNLFEEQKVFEVLVWSIPETRHNVSSISSVQIDTPDGRTVRLADVADISFGESPVSIKHDAVSRYIDVIATTRDRDRESVVADLEERLDGIAFPYEYHAAVLGDFSAREENERELLGFSIAALLGIFLLLQAAFNSWRLAAFAFLSLPVALVGGLVAAFLVDNTLSLGSLAGFLALLGIATRNSIMLIGHYQRLERDEGMAFGPELVMRGAKERLKPMLMTALATGLALIPLAIPGRTAGHEIIYPMTIVILGGLITTTLLSLFIVPILYLRFSPGTRPVTTESRAAISPTINPAPAAD